MGIPVRIIRAGVVALLAAVFGPASQNTIDPRIARIVDDVSEARIRATIEKLAGFGTRNTMSSQDDPQRGIGAARAWIFSELKSYSPRLEVRYDQWRVKKQGQRIYRDADLYNVVAVLPGRVSPATEVWVTGHYDSLNLGSVRTGASASGEAVGERPTQTDWEKLTDLAAPGACDDASGTAAVMELARVMSQYEFSNTLVFATFAGEEQGLIGAGLQAAKARKEAVAIEAVLNNDIIGTDMAGNGLNNSRSVSVYSDESLDSPSQQLARYAREVGARYVPSMEVNTIFFQDRLARGGDHIPFQQEGFAAVRFSTPNENYDNQHSATDTLANMSVPYTARVTRIDGAVAASLALAPEAPDVSGAPPRKLPRISRGQSRYDARLQWKPGGSEANIKGYAVVMRATTSPFWEREILVGKVQEYTLENVSIDEFRFGVKAIGGDGSESLVSAYVYPPRAKTEIETVP